MRYDVATDGALSQGRVFFDMTKAEGEDAIDGIKVDVNGTLYVSGPGGLWVISAMASTWGRSSRRVTSTTWRGEIPTEDPVSLRPGSSVSDAAERAGPSANGERTPMSMHDKFAFTKA